MLEDRELSKEETEARGLPTGGCCCLSHSHQWYERIKDDAVWLECYFCSMTR